MAHQYLRRNKLTPATHLGLVLALVGPMLPPLFDPILFGSGQTLVRIEWGIAIHWINLAALIGVVLYLERLPLASIGLRRLRWWTIILGMVAGAAILNLSGMIANVLKVKPDAHFAALLMSLPFAVRVLLVITAGVFEETLYRGYALERLATAFNSKWVAAGITVVLFTLAHVPAVGLTHLIPIFIVSLLVTLLYLWRRDLVVNIVAHATIDGVGLLLVPWLSHH
ncbi:MAG: CPBP family intramembrane metalloprotease [Alphaproteobacteria bacterium]|nr:CPBP family intramembrane metalloprotease [Alphaproteobacteria bacterium]